MRQGGCQCGELRYECTEQPLKIYVCHCAECRKQSASAFGISYFVNKRDFFPTRGTPHVWTRITAGGHQLDCAFCAECGSRAWHCSSRTPGVVNVKAGSLDQAVDISTAVHIWCSRKMPGVVIPDDAEQYLEQPSSPA